MILNRRGLVNKYTDNQRQATDHYWYSQYSIYTNGLLAIYVFICTTKGRRLSI